MDIGVLIIAVLSIVLLAVYWYIDRKEKKLMKELHAIMAEEYLKPRYFVSFITYDNMQHRTAYCEPFIVRVLNDGYVLTSKDVARNVMEKCYQRHFVTTHTGTTIPVSAIKAMSLQQELRNDVTREA